MEHQRDKLATKRDLDKVEQKLTGRIDQVEQRLADKIGGNSKKIDANSAKIDQVEQRLADKIDGNSKKIDANGAKIDQVEQRLADKIGGNSKKIDANSAKIAENGKKIAQNGKKIDNLTTQVINNREEIKKMVTRTEFNKRLDELLHGQDKMMTVFTRLDQKQAATTARIDRIESGVERLKER